MSVYLACRIGPCQGRFGTLARIIHERRAFVNHAPRIAVPAAAGFDAVLRTLLRASPERRPSIGRVEARRADDSTDS
jgi:hypothetical protein